MTRQPLTPKLSGCMNLDGISEDELRQVASYHEHTGMRAYALNKLEAVNLRRIGHINAAVDFEARCDRIYERMPKKLKW